MKITLLIVTLVIPHQIRPNEQECLSVKKEKSLIDALGAGWQLPCTVIEVILDLELTTDLFIKLYF